LVITLKLSISGGRVVSERAGRMEDVVILWGTAAGFLIARLRGIFINFSCFINQL